VQNFVEIRKLRTELGASETGMPLTLGHGEDTETYADIQRDRCRHISLTAAY